MTLVTAVTSMASRVRLRFVPKPEKLSDPLRDGHVDVEIGVLGEFAPEVRTRAIFRDRFVGAVRAGHPFLCAPVTPEAYAAAGHMVASRRGVFVGPVDGALGALKLQRDTVVVVPAFSDALRIARRSDLVALVPRSCLEGTGQAAEGLVAFDLPVDTPEIVVSAFWHPRMEADAGHRWFRETVVTCCLEAVGSDRNAR